MKCSSSVVSLVNDGERLLDMGSLPFSLSHITEEDSSIFLFIFFPLSFGGWSLYKEGRKKQPEFTGKESIGKQKQQQNREAVLGFIFS